MTTLKTAGVLRFGLLSVSILSFSAIVHAQQSKPVARLISSIKSDACAQPEHCSNTAKGSRPRVVSAAWPKLESATSIERRAFELTNKLRAKEGLQTLSWDPELCHLARLHSQKMALENFFSHRTPDGQRLRDRARVNGIGPYRMIAENIAFNQGYEDPGAFAVERWMVSSGHRANILYSGFQAAAVGSFVAEDGSVYLTQVFIAR